MKIFLIRHGETIGDVESRYGGSYDDNLTSKGEKQAAQLAKKLDKDIEVIYFSPLKRSKETIEILKESTKGKSSIKFQEVKDLKERNHYGILSGLTKKEALKKYPTEVAKLEKSIVFHNVKNSESYDKFKERIIKAFNDIISDDNHKAIAILSHAGPIRCVFRELFTTEFRKLEDCCIIEIDKEGNSIRIGKAEGAEII